jgi:hypothetical protein
MNSKQPSLSVLRSFIVLFASLLNFIALPGSLFAQPVNAPLISINELQPGMKGEVWTVFKGSTPEPFSVQVSGILRNALGPGKSLILCELTDARVQLMGAVAGMSGSPLYVEGKLAGVLSYQIQHFETVRYAGSRADPGDKRSQFTGDEPRRQRIRPDDADVFRRRPRAECRCRSRTSLPSARTEHQRTGRKHGRG